MIHIGSPGRYRGAFRGLGSDDAEGRGRRLWVLHSPEGADDQLREVDTITGSVLQTLEVSGASRQDGWGKDSHELTMRAGHSLLKCGNLRE